MKTISQIIAGAQVLLNVSYELKGCFEEYLSDDYKTFLHMLRVIEEQMSAFVYTKFFCQELFWDRKDQPVDPAQERYNIRTTVERANSTPFSLHHRQPW